MKLQPWGATCLSPHTALCACVCVCVHERLGGGGRVGLGYWSSHTYSVPIYLLLTIWKQPASLLPLFGCLPCLSLKVKKKKNSQIVLYSHTAEPSYCTIQHNRNRCILWWVVEGNVRKKIKNHHIGFEFLYLSSTNTNPGLFYYLYFPISLTHSWPNIYNIIPEWIIPACTDISLFYSWGKWVVKWSVKKKKKKSQSAIVENITMENNVFALWKNPYVMLSFMVFFCKIEKKNTYF